MLYSMGLVFLELSCSRANPPFSNHTDLIELCNQISLEINNIVATLQSMLNPNHDERPDSGEVFNQFQKELSNSKPQSAVKVSIITIIKES